MAKRPLPTVSIHVVRGIFAEAIARGEQPMALCARFGVTPLELADVDARVTVDLMRRLWSELPTLLGATDFGLAVARRAEDAGALHVLGYLARTAGTVSDALKVLLRYQRLLQDAMIPRWIEAGDAVRIVFEERDPAFWMPRHAIEFGIASVLLLARKATGHQVAPIRVEVRHARPADDAEARRLFACDIRYESGAHAVTLASADLALPLRSADPQLSALLDRHAHTLEERLPARGSFETATRKALADTLASGDTGLHNIALKLRVSGRTLQRRLRDEGTTHQRVLDTLRRDLATRYLEEQVLGIQEVVFLLGFSDQSAFHHAFVRWTGVAPGAYRSDVRARATVARPDN